MKTIYIGGTFDLFHTGHVNLFKNAKKIAQKVVVALNTDEFSQLYKGRRTVMSLPERIEMVKSCRYVDVVDINDGGTDSKPCILRNKPDYILHGDDWSGEDLMKQMGLTEKFLKDNKIQMKYVPYTEGISTTQLLARINSKPKIIAFDMDGTLCTGSAWVPEDVLKMVPNEKMIKEVNRLYSNNFIIIYTARRDNLIENTIKWLRLNGVNFHAISNNKIPADHYIDDKMVDFEKVKDL